MKTTISQICSAIKFRTDECKIYWRVRTAEGGTRYVSFCWGELPTERLEKFLKWINEPTINNRKKICRMIALSKLPKDKLRDSDFLKNGIFERLKLRQQQGRFFGKSNELTPEQETKAKSLCDAIIPQIKEIKNDLRKGMAAMIQAANCLRNAGQLWELATDHKRFLMRDYTKISNEKQSLQPLLDLPSPVVLRLAMSVWRIYPDEITNYHVAKHIFKRLMKLEDRSQRKT